MIATPDGRVLELTVPLLLNPIPIPSWIAMSSYRLVMSVSISGTPSTRNRSRFPAAGNASTRNPLESRRSAMIVDR